MLPENLRLEATKDLPYNEGHEMSRAMAIARAE
jgi:hypothetical protein